MAEKSPTRARTTRAPKTTTPTPKPTALEAAATTKPDGVTDAPAPKPVRATRTKANGTRPAALATKSASPQASAKPKRATKAAAAGRKVSAEAKTEPKAPRVTKKSTSSARRTASGLEVPRTDAQPARVATSGPLSVLIVSSEAMPFSPPGTLGEFVGALPSALGSLGHRVTVVVPKYAGVATPSAPVDRFEVPLGDGTELATVYEVPLGLNARTILVEHPGFFEREHVYGPAGEDYPDNPARFAFLSRAALEFAAREGERVDVVQSYDWQTGLVPVYLRTSYANAPALAGAKSVFTICNIAFQGLCDAGWLSRLGLGHELFSVEGLEYWGRVSLLKGGINFADVVSAPGEDAVERLLTPGGGAGFEGILAARGEAFRGVAPVANGHGSADDEWAVPGIVRRLSALYGEAVATRPPAH